MAAPSAKCGRCFSRISEPGEYCLSSTECKRSTLCCHPGSRWPAFCLGRLVRHSSPHKGCDKTKGGSSEFMPRPAPFQHRIVTKFRLPHNPKVEECALFYCQETGRETTPRDTRNNLSRMFLSDRWIIPKTSDVHVFNISAIFHGLRCHGCSVVNPYGSHVMDALNEGC